MKYDFTTVLDRHGRDSLAFDKIPFTGVQPDEGFDAIPMWIADMSFVAAPPAMEAILKRMEMPNFGYFALPDEYFDSIINWQRTRNGVEGLLPEHIGYENGVLGGVSSAVQSFTSPGDKILIHSPSISRRSQSPRMQGTASSLSTRRARPFPWPDLSGPTISSTTNTCVTASSAAAK